MRLRTRNRTGHLGEFPLALFVLLFFVSFPAVNLLGLATGAATMYLLAHTSATRAAAQEQYENALSGVKEEAESFLKTGFASFSRLKPCGGFEMCGCDLFVTATNYRTQEVLTFGPNTPVPPPVDASNFIYEYSCRTTCEVGPTVNLSNLPFIGAIPGIGKPVELTCVAHRAVEHPKGLGESEAASTSGADKYFQSRVTAPGQEPQDETQVVASGWNYPNLYQMIEAAGQVVVASTVLQVPANKGSLTDTTLTVAPGQRLWFDFKADGQWSFEPGRFTDADGSYGLYGNRGTSVQWNSSFPAGDFTQGSLVGHIITPGEAYASPGSFFFVGKDKRDYEPKTSGSVALMMNDSFNSFHDNEGVLTVRIVVTEAK
ncbi:MAG TPA: hypothetical protein V6D17_17955 [Candidatus Obscuribacterales bacterium]